MALPAVMVRRRRFRLDAAVAEDRERPYYDSWLVALEALVTEDVQVAASDLMSRRMASASYWIDEAGHEDLEVFPLAVSEPALLDLLTLVFDQWWEHICFGPLINGAVYELRPPHRPTLSLLDGYLTIDFGAGHVHLCIGEHRAAPALTQRRQCDARRATPAPLGRRRADLLDVPDVQRRGGPAAHRAAAQPLPRRRHGAAGPARLGPPRRWDELRARFLGLPADPLDRSGDGFRHP